MVIVAFVKHCPYGLKVYSVVAKLFNSGDQVPVIPFNEVNGKADKFPPLQIPDTCVNVGVSFGVTSMVIVAVVAHCPSSGVKVYSVVTKLLNVGDQVPEMSFSAVIGKPDIYPPLQIAEICVNIGV